MGQERIGEPVGVGFRLDGGFRQQPPRSASSSSPARKSCRAFSIRRIRDDGLVVPVRADSLLGRGERALRSSTEFLRRDADDALESLREVLRGVEPELLGD